MKEKTLKILAVSPRFAPSNAPDSHRLRLLLAYAEKNNWQVEVLAVDSADVVCPVDQWLLESIPAEIPAYRVKAWPLKGWGLNGLAQRSILPLYRKGCDLLATGKFDLVFFSTTEFALHVLGVFWQYKFAVPFCMDFQDPWVSKYNYYARHPDALPPGGRIKYGIAKMVHRVLERIVVRRCAGFMAVSQAYLDDLKSRYPTSVSNKPKLLRPFPAEPKELESLGEQIKTTVGGQPHFIWRYVGVAGVFMHRAAAAFFTAWQQACERDWIGVEAVRFEAIGTSYARGAGRKKSIEPLVEGMSLADFVSESPERLDYSSALKALLQSDALIVFGSDDPAYTASKIYPYLLAGRPILAIFHENSSVVKLMGEVRGGVCVTFSERTTEPELAAAIGHAWFEHQQFCDTVPLNRDAFFPYTAEAQAQAVNHWFREILARRR